MIDTNKYIANTFLIPRGHAFVSAAPRHEPAGAQQTPHAVQLQLSWMTILPSRLYGRWQRDGRLDLAAILGSGVLVCCLHGFTPVDPALGSFLMEI